LHRRGYRQHVGIAPINEVLAAGLLLLSGWRGQCDFLDPMCGSATIPIEAAMIACNIPANINRDFFTFKKWADWDEELFEKIKTSLLSKTRDCEFSIRGFENNPKVAELAKENIECAALEDFVKIAKQDFFKSEKHVDTPLHILFNPPYDERIEVETEEFYQNIGNTLKQHYANTNAWMVTANLEALKYVGLRTSRRIPCYNGALEARLVKYEIYAGSRKRKAE
jgi:putative N6-adenine-specific DNA methylase